MSLTQIAQVFSILGVTVAIIKMGMETKKSPHKKNNKELEKIKKEIKEIQETISKFKERP